jgi:hypothetical protein
MLTNPGSEPKIRKPPRRITQDLNCPRTTWDVAEVALNEKEWHPVTKLWEVKSWIDKEWLEAHPSAKAPDHCRRKPRRAVRKIADELYRSHLNDNSPGGSKHGIKATRKKIVTGVVFHINLQI